MEGLMAEPEKGVAGVMEEEEEKLLEGVAVLDFDVLCSTVAMKTRGKWTKFDNHELENGGVGGEFGGVLRMWEGGLLDCFEDRRIALESACCPCYRFGKNMRRAGFGSCLVQGIVYFILAAAAFLNCIAFVVTKRNCFLFLGGAFTILVGTYLGFYRTKIKKKFNIKESRTLEMNNVQDGTWHGRGDTICIGGYGEGNKSFFQLRPPPSMSAESPDPCSMPKSINVDEHSWTTEVGHSVPLVAPSQY
ncbi:uncharacterized protein LOC114317744 isoform X2 [Camellia sinensis]|uniref:uncharacterized protein LOC114317744 isoform X2 n=1 Tax=Camellia sinensis TaxID=4442 RepID=UPI001035E2C1|nr:uncharacterized protein LOC114317744 isoform X2 [Camellia sinensis]